jgi:uncharacterized protein with HEPN domain
MKRAGRIVLDFLEDIADQIEMIRAFVGDSTFDTFENDDKTAYAVIRALEIIGEAAMQIPVEVRSKAPNVSWTLLAGMRDKLAASVDALITELALEDS